MIRSRAANVFEILSSKPWLSLSLIFAGATAWSIVISFIADETIESLRVSRQIADVWLDAEAASCDQIRACLERGGTECDRLPTTLSRPLAYLAAVEERDKPNPNGKAIERYLNDAAFDISLWRFRHRWFERVAKVAALTADIRDQSGNSRPRSESLSLKKLIAINAAAQALSKTPSSSVSQSEAIEAQLLSLKRGLSVAKIAYDRRAAVLAGHIRTFVYFGVTASYFLVFLICIWFIHQILKALHMRERRFADEIGAQLVVEQKQREQLLVKESALRQSNSDLQQFAYSASHDLKEPLRNIQILSQLVLRQPGKQLDELTVSSLQDIQANAARMTSMVSDLSTYTRLTSSGAADCNQVDMGNAVSEAIANLQTDVKQSNASIVLLQQLPAVYADPKHMVQIWQNLISNSIKFRRTEIAPHIEITAVPSEGLWQFTLRDNGLGFKNEYAGKIFELFSKLSRNNTGTGIGLALCKAIIGRYGGEIWASGTPGVGAEIHFTLPRSE